LAILSAVFTLFMIAVFPETLPRIVCYGYTPKWYLSLHQLLTRDRTISIIDEERQGCTLDDDERVVGLCGGRSASTSSDRPFSTSSRRSDMTLVGENHSGVATPIVLKRPPAPKLSDISFLAPYKYLGEWDILMICTMYAVNYGAYYAMTTSQSVLFTTIYNLSPFEIGLTFIPSGVGCALGSVIGGKIVDLHYEYFVIKMKAEAFSSASSPIRGSSDKEMKEFPIERARLRAVPWYAMISISSLIAYGWCLKRRSSLALPLVFQFLSKSSPSRSCLDGAKPSTHFPDPNSWILLHKYVWESQYALGRLVSVESCIGNCNEQFYAVLIWCHNDSLDNLAPGHLSRRLDIHPYWGVLSRFLYSGDICD